MWVQKVPGGGVVALAFAPDGRTLYTLDSAGWLTAWDTASRAGKRLPTNRRDPNWYSPKLSALSDGRLLAVQGAIAVWDHETGAEVSRIEPSDVHLHIWARVFPGGRVFAPNRPGTELRGWDVPAGRELPPLVLPGRQYLCYFDLAPDDRFMFAGLGGGPNLLYERDGDRLKNPVTLPVATSSAAEARFAPDGLTLALDTNGPSKLVLWDIEAGRPRVKGIECGIADRTFAFNPVLPVFVGIGADKTLTLFDLATGAVIRALDFALGRRVTCAAFSPDGLTCAIGGSNKQFAVFDVDV